MFANALLDLVEADAREERRVASRKVRRMVEFADVRSAEADREDRPFVAQQMRVAIADELADVTGRPLNWVYSVLAFARHVRGLLPETWERFATGDLDSYTLLEIGRVTGRLQCPDSFVRLDTRLAEYAGGHTHAQTMTWLRRRIASLEPQDRSRIERDAKAERTLGFTFHDEGGAEFWARMSTEAAMAEEAALLAALASKSADDPRTRDQFLFDTFHERLTQTPDGESLVRTEVVVTVPVTTLAGVDDLPAASLDERILLPADVIRDLADHEGTLFHRALTDEAGRILDVTRIGRFFEGHLRKAVMVRDGRCTGPGCQRPIREIDHITAWPDGPTSAANGQCLCKRTHQLKTAGVLTMEKHGDDLVWTLPSGRQRISEPVFHPPDDGLTRAEYFFPIEHAA